MKRRLEEWTPALKVIGSVPVRGRMGSRNPEPYPRLSGGNGGIGRTFATLIVSERKTKNAKRKEMTWGRNGGK